MGTSAQSKYRGSVKTIEIGSQAFERHMVKVSFLQ